MVSDRQLKVLGNKQAQKMVGIYASSWLEMFKIFKVWNSLL